MRQKSLAFIQRRLELLGIESVDDTPVGLEHLIVGNIIHGVLFWSHTIILEHYFLDLETTA